MKTVSVPSNAVPGIFYETGAGRGRKEFIILLRNPFNSSRLELDTAVELNCDPDFKHYFINDVDGNVVGSLLDVRDKFLHVSPLTVSRVLNHKEFIPFRCMTEQDSGGLFMFNNGAGSCLALSSWAQLPTSPLCITDRGAI